MPCPRDSAAVEFRWRWSCRSHSDLFRDRRLQLGQGHAESSRFAQHLAHQRSGLPGALARPAFGRDLAHERPCALAHLDEPFALQVAIGLNHGCRVHAQLSGEVPYRGERRARAELARRDRDPQAVRDLSVQRVGTTGIELFEHGVACVPLLRYSDTSDRRCQPWIVAGQWPFVCKLFIFKDSERCGGSRRRGDRSSGGALRRAREDAPHRECHLVEHTRAQVLSTRAGGPPPDAPCRGRRLRRRHPQRNVGRADPRLRRAHGGILQSAGPGAPLRRLPADRQRQGEATGPHAGHPPGTDCNHMTPQPQAHLPRPVHHEPPAHAPNAALLIDFDNITIAIPSELQTELKRLLQSDIIRGKVAVQRAYADWRRYQQYVVPLAESSIDLIFAPAYGSNKKNATDIRLAIDALELVFTRPEIGTFILLSGDSDFSALVLKLKEYGKYVIGVGIRESSSDLLIQNCDEYFSYNELAGLTKESDVTTERRDPWELVVEAVKQMTAHNDVMRSDRLKQVMQEIDPSFNEKDIGFSRFSKVVVEAAQRGLVSLTKLDNGQYELSLGPDVAGAAAQPTARGQREREPAASSSSSSPSPEPARERQASRGRGGRGGRGGGSGFSLGEAFGLLKQALGRLGAGERAVTADEVRDTMLELSGGPAAPLEAGRFPKLLRQAHDAEIIDLSKEDDGNYAVKLRPAGEPAAAAPNDDTAAQLAGEPMTASSLSAHDTPAAAAPPGGSVPLRSARFRRGSRGPRVTPPEIPKIGVVEVDPNFKPRMQLVQ